MIYKKANNIKLNEVLNQKQPKQNHNFTSQCTMMQEYDSGEVVLGLLKTLGLNVRPLKPLHELSYVVICGSFRNCVVQVDGVLGTTGDTYEFSIGISECSNQSRFLFAVNLTAKNVYFHQKLVLVKRLQNQTKNVFCSICRDLCRKAIERT